MPTGRGDTRPQYDVRPPFMFEVRQPSVNGKCQVESAIAPLSRTAGCGGRPYRTLQPLMALAPGSSPHPRPTETRKPTVN